MLINNRLQNKVATSIAATAGWNDILDTSWSAPQPLRCIAYSFTETGKSSQASTLMHGRSQTCFNMSSQLLVIRMCQAVNLGSPKAAMTASPGINMAIASTPSPLLSSVWSPTLCATAAVSVSSFIMMLNFGFHPLSTEIRELHLQMQHTGR